MITRPPIVVQGMKTSIVFSIKEYINNYPYKRWVEPFMGSGSVTLNIKPKYALLADTNRHIIQLYKDIQNKVVTKYNLYEFLLESKSELEERGDLFFYKKREEFNNNPNSFLFILLNKLSFNQLMRFNSKGKYNTSYCRRDDALSISLIDYITDLIENTYSTIYDWEFKLQDYTETFLELEDLDFLYLDPPYSGLHTHYYNSWSLEDSESLFNDLINLDYPYMLSLWYKHKEKTNSMVDQFFGFNDKIIIPHYYKIGGRPSRRIHSVEEMLILGKENKRHHMLRYSLKKDDTIWKY